MSRKFVIIISSILIVAGLFACGNNAEVEELKRQVAELKEQVDEKQEETFDSSEVNDDELTNSQMESISVWNTEPLEIDDELWLQIQNVKDVADYSDDTKVDEMDTVTFGSYPQSDSRGNIKEPVEWIVVTKNNNNALLLSKYILDYEMFDSDDDFENGSIKNWLNNDFCQVLFDSEITGYENIIGLINEDDVHNYFSKKRFGPPELDHNKLKTIHTNYAKSQYVNKYSRYKGFEKDEDDVSSLYWTSSYETYGSIVTCISNDGWFANSPACSRTSLNGVRPAMWVKY